MQQRHIQNQAGRASNCFSSNTVILESKSSCQPCSTGAFEISCTPLLNSGQQRHSTGDIKYHISKYQG
jgi:hypothetical protein